MYSVSSPRKTNFTYVQLYRRRRNNTSGKHYFRFVNNRPYMWCAMIAHFSHLLKLNAYSVHTEFSNYYQNSYASWHYITVLDTDLILIC